MKNEIYNGIYRYKEIPIDETCDLIYDPLQAKNIQGITRTFILQKYRIGEMIATKNETTGRVHIGFAVMHPDDSKQGYDKEGTRAQARSVSEKAYDEKFYVNKNGVVGVPHLIREDVAFFIDRAVRYFREPEIPAWATTLRDRYLDSIEEGPVITIA